MNAEGERTDLVFQDVLHDLSAKQRLSDGLVLTEWKKASTAKESENRFAAARAQAMHATRNANSVIGVENPLAALT